jgi:signal transduction histidine kinase
MLERLERAAARQRRFVGDASHELRTPLARIRAEVEVDLARPEDADWHVTHHSVLDETDQMQRLVDDLLILARADDGQLGARPHHVLDLDDVVLQEIRRAMAPPAVRIDASGVSAAQVDGNAEQLGRAVRNLLDNALRHAHGSVAVSLVESDGSAVLTVQDDGPGIPPERHDEVFARFARLDEARTRGAGGAGLGLAIVRSIAHAHGGRVEVANGTHSGARLVFSLPAVPHAPATEPVDPGT